MVEYSIELYVNVIVEADSEEEAEDRVWNMGINQCDRVDFDNIEEVD